MCSAEKPGWLQPLTVSVNVLAVQSSSANTKGFDFRPLTESTSLNRSLNNLAQVITFTTFTAVKKNLVEIRPWRASGQIFKELIYRSDRSPDFHAWWLKWRGLHARVCFFGFRWYCGPFRGSNSVKRPILGAWIGVIQPNALNNVAKRLVGH